MEEGNLTPEQPPAVGDTRGQQPFAIGPQNPGMQQNHPPQQQQLFNGPHPPQHPPPQAQPLAPEAIFAQLFHQFQQQQAVLQQNLQKQQQEFMRQQQELFRSAMSTIHQVPANPEIVLDSLANNIKEFRFDPESNITFAAWYARYDDLFEKDATRLDDEAKVRLLMRKMGAAEHERYTSFILPKLPKEYSFSETVRKLTVLFGAGESTVSKRYRCLQISKQPTEDYMSFACRLNKTCVEFELSKLTEEQFKCLMFVCALKAEEEGEIRTRLLSKIEERNDVTLEQLSEDCQRLLCLRRDTAMIESSSEAAVQFIKQKQQCNECPPKPGISAANLSRNKKTPATPCWYCGAMHFVRDCNYRSHKCNECGIIGHREGYCTTAKWNSKGVSNHNGNPGSYAVKTVSLLTNTTNKSRRFVQAALNGVEVRLQLDTGSDISIISKQMWMQIGKPPSTPAREEATAASGDHLKLLFKFHCDVFINNEKRCGQFYVVENSLQLLGIDMIEAFNLWSVPISTFCTKICSSYSPLVSLKAPGGKTTQAGSQQLTPDQFTSGYFDDIAVAGASAAANSANLQMDLQSIENLVVSIRRAIFQTLLFTPLVTASSGPQFIREKFQVCCGANGNAPLTAATVHRQMERFVHILYRSITKTQEGRSTIAESLLTFLLKLRSIPNQSAPDGRSLAEYIIGRSIRTSPELILPPPDRAEQQDRAVNRNFKRSDPSFEKWFFNQTWYCVRSAIT